MKLPKISIIMCNYNYANFLHDSLGSIANQTTPPYECIVIDDCSTDNSIEIINEYQKDHSFIKLIKNIHNKGVMYNINYGLKISKGNYVCFFSSDDFCSKYFIENTIKLLIKYPNTGICSSLPCFSHENGDFSHAVMPPVNNLDKYLSPSFLISLLAKGFFIAGHTSIINKKYLLDANGMLPKLKWHCDWFALLTIVFRHGMCFIPEKLAFLRIHSRSYSASFMVWREQKKVIKYLLNILQQTQYRDVRDKFFESKVILYLPYVCIYCITHPKYWHSLSCKTCFNIIRTILFKNLLEKQLFFQKIKNFLNHFIKINIFKKTNLK